MKKHLLNKTKVQSEKAPPPPLKISYIIILLAYALITVITPNLGALDSNGPKFLSLSLLNLFSFIFLISRKELRPEPKLFWSFFTNRIGLAYTLFMGAILVSFTKAINIPEAILSFSKYFTVFCAAYILSILLRSDKRYFRMLVIAMTFLLISDSITVFYNIFLYVSNQFNSIYEIKSVYSNKNILAAALFVKIPFALWLATFEKGWIKKLGFITLFCAELAVFFMSTRAFYLGLIFLSLVYGVFLVIVDMRNPNVPWFRRLTTFFGLLMLAFLLYSLTQHYLFPKSNDIYNKSYTERLSTISDGESGRLDSWKRSGMLIKEHPILGVGTGNWKIEVLKYENPGSSDFSYMYKNHNDFIEITAETGIFGSILFISIFVFVLLIFIKMFFRSGAVENSFNYLFLPAFGMICYSFDAFFNFPADRPELQSLFALFIGACIAFSPVSIKEITYKNIWKIRLLSLLFFILQIATLYVLALNFNSLKIQQIARGDAISGELNHNSSIFTNGYPFLPNINIQEEPIAVNKSRYLINEEKYQEAINLLRTDRSSPYDSRREFFMAMAFMKMGNIDSTLKYAYLAHKIKPIYFGSLDILCQTLEKKGKREEIKLILEDFVTREKNNQTVWLGLANIHQEAGNFQKAIETIDSAAFYLPNDSTILKQQHELNFYKKIIPYQQTYAIAMKYFDQQKFQEALTYFEIIIREEQYASIVYARRAVCYFYTRKYQACINDVNRSILDGYDSPELLNIRGACYNEQGKIDAACSDFHAAAVRGNKDALNNEQLFCKGK